MKSIRWRSTLFCLFASACLDGATAFSAAKLATRPAGASFRRSIHDRRPPSPVTIRPIRSELAHLYSSTADDGPSPQSPRSKLRRLTGFSLTALRSTLRAATGFSLTAFRTTMRAATGISLSETISGTIRRIMGVLHPGLRYFLQPFLIMYYAPMMAMRYYMVGPSREYVEESRKGHERVVDGWRKAVEAAEKANAGGYWPVHLNDDGTIVTSLPPDPNDVLDLADGIEKSVAAATTAAESAAA